MKYTGKVFDSFWYFGWALVAVTATAELIQKGIGLWKPEEVANDKSTDTIED